MVVRSGVGRTCDLNPVLLWLWPAATAVIRPLAWEPPNYEHYAQKKKKKKKKKKTKEKIRNS